MAAIDPPRCNTESANPSATGKNVQCNINIRSPLVQALGTAMAAIPAYQSAHADAPPAFSEMGIRYTHYDEDKLGESTFIFGSRDRYDIDVTQFWFEAPVGGSWSVALDVQNDVMSGASPWFIGTNIDGNPGVITSGASISDQRVEVGVTTRYFWADGNAGFNVAQSKEDDYEATSWAFDASWNSDDNARTWTTSLSSSNDTVEPEQGNIPVSVERDSLDTQSLYFGMSQILSSTALMRVGLSYTVSEGYLSDPYKLFDERPDRHERYAFSTGYRRHFIEAQGSLHLDYRYYNDSWGTNSHTAEIAWHQEIRKHSLKPYIRYYSQEQADFFAPRAQLEQRYYADDFRLSSYGAFTLGLRGVLAVGDWQFEGQVERYLSDHDWGLSGGGESPALVDFWRMTVGVSWRFD